MKRTRLRNQFLKTRTNENKKGTKNKGTIVSHYYKKQKRSTIVTLMQKMLLTTRPSGK